MMENKEKYFKNCTKKSLVTFIQVEGNFQSLFIFCVDEEKFESDACLRKLVKG